MEATYALTAEANQEFLQRIAQQASYNTPYLPEYDTDAITTELEDRAVTFTGRVSLNSAVVAYADDKFPLSEQTGADMESTQEIDVTVLFNQPPVQAVYAVKPIQPPRRVVKLGEDPGRFPTGIDRTQFVL